MRTVSRRARHGVVLSGLLALGGALALTMVLMGLAAASSAVSAATPLARVAICDGVLAVSKDGFKRVASVIRV
jgi:hypothetical protein